MRSGGLRVFVLVVVAIAAAQTLVLADQNEGITPAGATVQGHVSVGGLHTCAVLTSGEVQCWGGNDQGQLGNGTVTASTAPVTVSGITTATAVSAGNTHTCALLADGTARCWGLAANGQLGDGTTGDPSTRRRLTPVSVSGLTGATAISAGAFHSCAILADGTVKCWGDDGAGQLGDGVSGNVSLSAKPVSGITVGNPATAIAAGEFFTCALLADATVKCWGNNGSGQLGDGTMSDSATPVVVAGLPSPSDHPVLALTAGYGHTCVLLDDGTGLCWGQNTFGELGRETPQTADTDDGDAMEPSTVPLEVQFDSDPNPLTEDLETLSGMTAVSAGQFHTCALIDDGTGQCWGQNGRGQLGADPNPLTDELDDSSSAVAVSGLGGANAVTAGGFHSCAIVGTGVECWGYNFYGQLGSFDSQSEVPVQVTAVTGATTVTAGTGFACALLEAETPSKPVCWGDNTDGRLGAGLGAANATIRVAVSGIPSASSIDAGNGHACAVPAGSSSPKCWGLNSSGQLGDTTMTSSPTPVPVSGLPDTPAISAGGALGTAERGHTCAVRANGKVSCWGRNFNGQLGDDTTDDRSAPVTVQADSDPDSSVTTLADLDGASAVVTGGFHSCALTSGTVWCWGFNGSGQLGDDTTTERHWAVHVQTDTDPDVDAPLTGVVALAAGESHTCALIGDGNVMCWGANSHGQLGTGTPGEEHRPATVADIVAGNAGKGITTSPANAITAGDFHTCARLEDDSLLCWGENEDGQLGIGSTTDKSSPEVVFGPAPSEVPAAVRPVLRSISASRQNSCAVFVDTTVYCWGDNAHGQLGDGIGPTRATPAAVSGLAGSV